MSAVGRLGRPGGRLRSMVLGVLTALLPVCGLRAQTSQSLLVEGPNGSVFRIPVSSPRGYAALSSSELERLGWTFFQDRDVARARSTADRDLLFRAGNPWVRWGDKVYQLADPPYLLAGRLQLPLQVAVDLLPQILPEAYRFSGDGSRLRVLEPEFWRPDGIASVATTAPPLAAAPPPPSASKIALPSEGGPPPTGKVAPDSGQSNSPVSPAPSPIRVVVIDPGHGGTDPGAIGRRGVREKDVALALGRDLARELRRDSTLEVHMTRASDTLIPLWKRGEMATSWKGDRPGVFISLHANALPHSRSTRGYETYFLSEARTEHERRVAAIENAPLNVESQAGEGPNTQDLDFIWKDLRTLDYQHWSKLLAEMVQKDLEPVHPGPDRGVKQAPFAVITNALMPSILVEIGFLTNSQEELILGQPGFQSDVAKALARAVREFFERYPPGGNAAAGTAP